MLLKNPKIFVESVTALNRIIRFEGFPIGLDKRDTWAYHEKSQSEKMRNLTTQRVCLRFAHYSMDAGGALETLSTLVDPRLSERSSEKLWWVFLRG